jgi:flagellar basal body-associated protein FliL
MIAILIMTAIVILAVAMVATVGSGGRDAADVLSEREAADRLRPYSGAVESAPQSAPVGIEEEA